MDIESQCCTNDDRPSLLGGRWVIKFGYYSDEMEVSFCPFCGQKPFIKENPDEKAFEAGFENAINIREIKGFYPPA